MNDTLTQDQQAALDTVKTGRNVFITGPGGTGKSYLLDRITEADPSIAITATTGIAACNVGGVTLHSWAGLGLGKDDATTCARRLNYDARKRIESTRTLIVDEVSMAGPELIDLLDEVLRIARGVEEPFGGVQVLFTGDFLQLPPVYKGSKVRYAFEADAWGETQIEVCQLGEIVRQSDPVFADILNALRFAEDYDYGPLADRVGAKATDGTTRLHTHNKTVDAINAAQVRKLPGNLAEFPAVDGGHEQLVKDSRLPAILEVKPGARVMFLANQDPLYNGLVGTVVDVPDRPGDPISVEFEGLGVGEIRPLTREVTRGVETVPVTRSEGNDWIDQHRRPVADHYVDETAEMATRPRVVASRTQYPLRLAYAITVHKSQGMTLDNVRVDLRRAFAPGQVYTALSRCRSLDGLYIDAIGEVYAHPKAVEFYRQLN